MTPTPDCQALTRPTPTTSNHFAIAPISAGEVEAIRIQASVIAASELISGNGNVSPEAAQATAAIKLFAARELGLPPVLTAAGNLIHVIEGKLSIGVHGFAAKLASGGVVVDIIEETNEQCTLTLTREGRKPYTRTQTMADAKERGLTADNHGGTKKNWRSSPAHMLYARCLSDAAKRYASDVVFGMYLPEDFGYTEDDAASAPVLDQDAPLGAGWAKAFTAELAKLPNTEATRAALEAIKAERYGSSSYKLQAVPRADEAFWQEWLEERRAKVGQRIGEKAAKDLWGRVKQVAEKSGTDEALIVAVVKEKIDACRLRTAADLNETQAREIVELIGTYLAQPEVTDADFTVAVDSGGRAQRLVHQLHEELEQDFPDEKPPLTEELKQELGAHLFDGDEAPA